MRSINGSDLELLHTNSFAISTLKALNENLYNTNMISFFFQD